MKTIEIESLLFTKLDVRRNLIVKNVSWGIEYNMEQRVISGEYKSLHECDVLALSKSGFATEYEIKISVGDLKNDSTKTHAHKHDLIKYFYFVVPEKLKDKALSLIPNRAGLYLVIRLKNGSLVLKKIKDAKKNKKCFKWTDDQRFQLARLGAMRSARQLNKIINYQNIIKDLKQKLLLINNTSKNNRGEINNEEKHCKRN